MTSTQRRAAAVAAIMLGLGGAAIGLDTLRDALNKLLYGSTGEVGKLTVTDALNALADTTRLTDTDAANLLVSRGVAMNFQDARVEFMVAGSGFFKATNEFQDTATVGMGDSTTMTLMSLWRPLRLQYSGVIRGATFYLGAFDSTVTEFSIDVWRRVPDGGGKCVRVGNSGNLVAQLTADTLNTVVFPNTFSAEAGDLGASFRVVVAPTTVPIDSILTLSDSVWTCTDSLWTNTDSAYVCTDSLWTHTDSLVICDSGHYEVTDSMWVCTLWNNQTCVDSALVYTDSSFVCDDTSYVYTDSTWACVDSSLVYTDSTWACIDSSLSVDSTWAWTDSVVVVAAMQQPMFAVTQDSMPGDDFEDDLWNGLVLGVRGGSALPDTFNWYTSADTLADSSVVKVQLLMQPPQAVVYGDAVYLGGGASSSFAWAGTDSAHKDTLAEINSVGLASSLMAAKPITVANLSILEYDTGLAAWTGLTTDDQLRYLDRFVLALEPRIAFVQFGQNDYGRVPLSRTVTNINAMLDSLDAHGIYPIIYSPVKINLMSAGYKASVDSLIIRTLEASTYRTYEPQFLFMPGINSVYNGTGAYPNTEGALQTLFDGVRTYTLTKKMRFDPSPSP
jgi:hypothetical protein